MARRLSVRADLAFTVEVPGQHTLHGHLRGAGRRLLLVVDRPEVFASRADSGAVRVLAEGLAQRGLTIEVRQGDTHLITMGDTVAPWWQRRATGSRHIRLGSLRGVWTSARSRFGRGAAPVLPDGGLVPPGTLLPLVPTFRRRVRQPVATTHDPARGGRPRLVVVKPGGYQPGERQRVFWLTQEVTTIGSGEDCGLRLSGLADLHVEIVHDDQDEYVVRSHDPDVRVNGAQVREQFLRTGSRLQLGPWTFAYSREEYADHGRPYGGRIGGELGHQQPQPPRRRLQDDDREVT